MRILFTIILVIPFLVNEGLANESNTNKDYIWARSGLNVRSGPGTSYDIIEKLSFGDSVTVLTKTDKSYNITGIQEVDKRIHYYSRKVKTGPFILYGDWVEIYTTSGNIGYVVSQYLINVKPNVEDSSCPFEEISRDTLSIYDEITSFETNVTLIYKYGIKRDIAAGKCYMEQYVLPEYTIQQAFVMLMNSRVKNLKVIKNWPNELVLGDGSMYNYYFNMKDGAVCFRYEACC